MGPGCGIQEGSLDHVVVSFGKGLRFPKGNIGKEFPVPATDAITLGSPNGTIFHCLELGGIAHLLIALSLFEVGNHALKLSIGSHEVQDLLLAIQIIGVVGIQINIKISHEDRCMSIGWALIKGSLGMSMEVIQLLLPWQKLGSNDGDFANSGTTQTTHAVVSMTTDVFQVTILV